jgi:GMP synthase (glutamine-hydrolysing)
VRVLAIVHQPDAGPGVFAEAIAERGDDLDTWPIAEVAEPPSSPRDYDAVLTFGGSMDTYQDQEYPWLSREKALLAALLQTDVPLMGVCLGAQLVAEAAGPSAQRASRPEIGWHEVEVTPDGAEDPLLAPLAPGFIAFQWHSFEAPLPPGATALARSAVCLQAYRIGEVVWGIQFHAEVSDADAHQWIDEHRSNGDKVPADVDVDLEALRVQTRAAIGDWNRLGRELCGRFLDAAARA